MLVYLQFHCINFEYHLMEYCIRLRLLIYCEAKLKFRFSYPQTFVETVGCDEPTSVLYLAQAKPQSNWIMLNSNTNTITALSSCLKALSQWYDLPSRIEITFQDVPDDILKPYLSSRLHIERGHFFFSILRELVQLFQNFSIEYFSKRKWIMPNFHSFPLCQKFK